MLYLPLRMPYFLYEAYENTKQKAIGIISILLVAAAAVLPLFEGEYSLEKALNNSIKVEILFLNSNGLDIVPDDVKKLPNLRVLHLGFNRLQSLPPWITELNKLEWIGLGGNHFREFPVELLKISRLKEVDIHYNRIKKMPENLSPFKRLRVLNLKSNSMSPEEKSRIKNSLQLSEKNPDGISLTL